MDQQTQVDAGYTDFQKAFDKVDHELLLNKLTYNGIRGDSTSVVHIVRNK